MFISLAQNSNKRQVMINYHKIVRIEEYVYYNREKREYINSGSIIVFDTEYPEIHVVEEPLHIMMAISKLMDE